VLAPWQASANFAARIINMYGPTECTDIATENRYQEGEGAIIGKPIDQVALLVLNRARQLVPAQAAGELYIGGAGVARGYLNQPALTDEKFIPNPFAAETGCPRLYRTGDLVRWLPDGRLEFLGRVDQQVKIRGLRIEPGEVEQVLLGHADVKEALVLAADQRLLAYVVASNSSEQLPAQLRSHLQATLPDYMIPAAFVVLERFPLTPNGKLDRKALPAPDMAQNATAYIAPTSDLEAALCAIWQELLGVERVGMNDDFFKLGGHSLLAIRMLTQVRQQLGVAVALNGVFGEPTVAGLARVIETLQLTDSVRRQLVEAELADAELEEGFI
jgi:acyl carrier protein